MKEFGAQGVALLLMFASTSAFCGNPPPNQPQPAAAGAEVSELQEALTSSREEAAFIRERNKKLAHRQQLLEKRIAEMREQLLQQEQSLEPLNNQPPTSDGAVRGETVSEGVSGAAPEEIK
jgi:TolA-binding protein